MSELATAAVDGDQLPRSIEDGATPPALDFDQPAVVVVIPFVPATVAKAA
jgi:hypothetical protein